VRRFVGMGKCLCMSVMMGIIRMAMAAVRSVRWRKGLSV
jgi:hypothetical protein